MIAELASFNISVTDQSPLFQYLPYRDGPLDTSWNVSYSANSPQEWAPDKFFGTSESSHTTYLNGASVQIEWTGTAFWLYGSADPGSYEIQVDGDQHTVGDGATDSILFGRTDLPYGWHSVNLTVVDAPVSITGATLTVKMGEEGSELQSRNISTVTNSIPPAANPLFLSDGDAWSVNSSYGFFGPTVESYPRVTTDVKAASLSFTLNSTVGFAIYGSCDFDMGSYNVTIDPIPPIGPATGTFNASSHWIALNEIKYMATGLDRTKNYSVTVTNNQEARLDVAQVMVFDAVPASASGSSSAPASVPSELPRSSHAGLFAGIGAGIACIALVAVIALYLIYQHRRYARAANRRDGMHIVELESLSPATCAVNADENSFITTPYTKAYAELASAVPAIVVTSPTTAGTEAEQQSSEPAMPEQAARRLTVRAENPYSTARERDAGRVVLVRKSTKAHRIRPPTYNPAWFYHRSFAQND